MATLSELTSRRVFTGLILLSIALLAIVVWPFSIALFVAAVFAGLLAPMHRWLTAKLRGRSHLAATGLVLAVFLVIVGPIAGLATFAVKEASSAAQYVADTIRGEGMQGLVKRLPEPIEGPIQRALEKVTAQDGTPQPSLQEQATAQGAKAAKVLTGAAAATFKFLLHGALMLIALYFFLTDGGKLVAWLERHSPLKAGQTFELMLEFRKVSVAVITSSVVTAAVQALAALVGYFIARVPYAIFFAGVTFFVALIPAVGAAAVCLVAALLLFATGHPAAALFLAIWGVTVVGLVDNIVKPILARRGLEMHGAIVFFSLLGGIAAFGPVGLLVGPMIVAFFLALVRIHERDYGRRLPPEERDEPVEAPKVELAEKAESLDDDPNAPAH